jgi:zinc and cadmium transporter
MVLAWILLFSFAGTVGTVLGASLLLISADHHQRKIITHLVSYAVGTLLAVAFLRLLPHALEAAPPGPVMATVLAGIIAFFLLEKVLLWRHCHDSACEVHGVSGSLILVGDGVHNFIDGILIAAAFLTDFTLGVATGLAIILHEVPQEIGDFSLLLDQGIKRGRAFFLNILASLSTLPGALLGYFLLDWITPAVPYVLAFSAASFIYIATVDLIANMHRRSNGHPAPAQFVLVIVGVATIALLGLIGHGH